MTDEAKIIVGALVSFFTGGALGALLGNRAAISRQRTEIALSLIKDTFARWSEIRDICDKVLDRKSVSAEDCLLLEKTGDWYELIAHAYESRVANRELFDQLEMKRSAIDFAAIVDSAFNQQFLTKDYLKNWPYLKALREARLRELKQ